MTSKEEYENCYENNAHLVYGYLLSKGMSEAKATSMLQKVFVEFFSNQDHFDAKKLRCFTWLLQIANRILKQAD